MAKFIKLVGIFNCFIKTNEPPLGQYVIYDFDSFMADWGGYMGLVLGYSLLAIYDDLVKITLVMLNTSLGGLPFTSPMKQRRAEV